MLTKHILWSRLWIDPGSTPCDPGVDLGSTLKIGIVAQPGRCLVDTEALEGGTDIQQIDQCWRPRGAHACALAAVACLSSVQQHLQLKDQLRREPL